MHVPICHDLRILRLRATVAVGNPLHALREQRLLELLFRVLLPAHMGQLVLRGRPDAHRRAVSEPDPAQQERAGNAVHDARGGLRGSSLAGKLV
jgi:hypothetical protein